MKNKNEIRDAVRKRYHNIVTAENPEDQGCCAPKTNQACCGSKKDFDLKSLKIGYSDDEINRAPEGSNIGLGCGNPQAIAKLKKGETVVDLGCGAGFDIFLAAQNVGEQGKAIGVDMTPSMITKARLNAEKTNFRNVEFRLGEIEHLPVANEIADVIISNCVINLSPDKQQVFNESYRILKKGGRLAISDVVNLKELPESVKNDMELYGACISGASTIGELSRMLEIAGFIDIAISPKDESREFIKEWDENDIFADYVISASIEARKP